MKEAVQDEDEPLVKATTRAAGQLPRDEGDGKSNTWAIGAWDPRTGVGHRGPGKARAVLGALCRTPSASSTALRAGASPDPRALCTIEVPCSPRATRAQGIALAAAPAGPWRASNGSRAWAGLGCARHRPEPVRPPCSKRAPFAPRPLPLTAYARPVPVPVPVPAPAPVYYTLISGSLLVINKVAIVALPAPTFLLLCQLVFSAAAVWLAGAAGLCTLTRAAPRQLVAFLPVAASFIGTVFSNFKVPCVGRGR
jgi:hypothetical protein